MEVMCEVLGIDVSKLKFDIELLINGKVKMKVLQNIFVGYKSLLEWIDKLKVLCFLLYVCMEVIGVYYEVLVLILYDVGIKVSIVNFVCIKGFGYGENICNKNDEIDVGFIVCYCLVMNLELWMLLLLEQC